MKDDQENKELLSALVDGELYGDELEQALAWVEDSEGLASWQLYHMVGDVLRSPDLAHHSQHDLLSGLRVQLSQEPVQARQPQQPSPLSPPPQLSAGQVEQVAPALQAAADRRVRALRDPAVNAPAFRWRVAAGVSAAVAVAAIGWNLVAGAQDAALGAQWAQWMQAPVVQVASEDGDGVMLRDPRLDALMAAQQEHASRASLQVPADFLRNASLASRSSMVVQQR